MRLAEELKRTKKSAPSTSCWSTAATTSVAFANTGRSACSPRPERFARHAPDVDRRRELATISDGLTRLPVSRPAQAPAPKVRAMEIIKELEPSDGARCWCGRLPGFAGNLDFALRSTADASGTRLREAGAGIVMDSNPAAEYEETRDNGASLRAGTGLGRA